MGASNDEISLVIERLRVMPRDVKLNLGSYGPMGRDQLIDAVSKHTEIGELVVQMQMSYIRSFKERVKA
jgi:hypothetical protein